MAGRSPPRTQETRRRIAVETARLISESGLRDYGQAKRKAAERLGIFDEASLPANREIEDALREHQRLFRGADRMQVLRRLRETAREAMQFFAAHEPRLVGPVLEGTADEHSAVCLHLYSERPREVAARLQEHAIPYEERSRALRLDRTTTREFPVLRFSAGDAAIDVTVLPYDLLRQAPLDRISEKPMQRATATILEALLREEGSSPSAPSHG